MRTTIQLPLDTTAAELFTAAGIFSERQECPKYLALFATQSDRVLNRLREMVVRREIQHGQAVAFQQLLIDCCARVLCHPIIASNLYLQRFARGVTLAQARHEIQQFSVFGLQFDVAQAKLVANAPTEQSYRERLQVLLNEKGIPYEDGFEGELTGKWSYATIHFTWMQRTARDMGLEFEELGKIWVGLSGTKQFVERTFETYASPDQCTAAGASFAIENWAANALWTPWIAGMNKLNAQLRRKIDLGYLTYHEAQEAHHSQATIDELFENFLQPWFDTDRFLDGAETILTEGVQRYYESQLDALPDKDGTWPDQVCLPRQVDPAALPRLATPMRC